MVWVCVCWCCVALGLIYFVRFWCFVADVWCLLLFCLFWFACGCFACYFDVCFVYDCLLFVVLCFVLAVSCVYVVRGLLGLFCLVVCVCWFVVVTCFV